MVLQTGAHIITDLWAILDNQLRDLDHNIGIYTGLFFDIIRGEFFRVVDHFLKSDAVVIHQPVIILAGFYQIADQTPGHGTVGARQRLGKNIGIAGNGIQSRIDHHQIGTVCLGIGKLGHERRVAHGRVGAEKQNQIGLGIV